MERPIPSRESTAMETIEIACPTTGQTVQLGRRDVISRHHTAASGPVVYLRCTCGQAVLVSRAGTRHGHGRNGARTVERELIAS